MHDDEGSNCNDKPQRANKSWLLAVQSANSCGVKLRLSPLAGALTKHSNRSAPFTGSPVPRSWAQT